MYFYTTKVPLMPPRCHCKLPDSYQVAYSGTLKMQNAMMYFYTTKVPL